MLQMVINEFILISKKDRLHKEVCLFISVGESDIIRNELAGNVTGYRI